MAEKTEQPFDKLLSELDVMAKALDNDADDDARIKGAAADGNTDTDNDGDDDNDYDNDGDGDENMGKSFMLKSENGEEFEAIDGTELVKSLIARLDTTESSMTKALTAAVDLIGKQGAMIKSLQADVTKLAGSGKGRKTVLTVHEKVATGDAANLQKSQGDHMSGHEFMTKALQAQKEGKINGLDVSIAETCLNKSQPIPEHIVARVLR